MPEDSAGRHYPSFALIAIAVAIHAPFVGGGFLTDDYLHLERLSQQTMRGVFASPDTFGFYRPVPQASLLLNLWLAGPNAWVMRLTNVLIHAGVIWAAYALARALLGSGPGAFFATLAFVLTPKAHPVAVLWISARAELLMALFSLLAIVAWLRWQRGDGNSWAAAAWGSYVLALSCKETAVLLPLLLLFTPPGAQYLTRARAIVLAGMALTAAAMLFGRIQIGALMPISSDAHYDMTTPVRRWLRNGRNYLWRALVSPLALVVLVAAARGSAAGVWSLVRRQTLGRRVIRPGEGADDAEAERLGTRPSTVLHLTLYGGVWFAVFLAPVLPIAARSEHYLYVPVFGLCLAAGAIVEALVGGVRAVGPRYVAALFVYAVGVGGFQVSRAAALHADASFSAKFLDELRQNPAIARHDGSLVIIPENDVARRFLQDSIGGYIGTAFNRALGRHIPAGLGQPDSVHAPDVLVLSCSYVDGRVILRPHQR